MDHLKSLTCHGAKSFDTSAYQTYNAYTDHKYICYNALYFKQSDWSYFGKTSFRNLNIDNTGHVIFKYICSYQQFLLFALKIMEDNIT